MDNRNIFNDIYSPSLFSKTFFDNPLTKPPAGKRPLSAGIFGLAVGDEGKGLGILRLNYELLKLSKELYSIRTGGGGNAGHDVLFKNGKRFVFSQVPVAVAMENATGICGKAMFLHPEDILYEIEDIKKLFGKLPGKFLIDSQANLSPDTLRALESVMDQYNPKERLSVKRGMSPTEAFRIMKIGLKFDDLISEDWQERMAKHYDFVRGLMSGLGYKLSEVDVATYGTTKKRKVGTKDQFIERLFNVREKIYGYISTEIFDLYTRIWNDRSIAISFESQQAFGLSPYFGIDYTSTEPGPRSITITTDGLIQPENVGAIFGTIKIPWMSSSGKRFFPGGQFPSEIANPIRKDFREVGRTDPLPRDIFIGQLPLYQLAASIDKPDYLYFTHLDASLEKIPVAINYYNKNDSMRSPKPYRPSQTYLNTLNAEVVDLPGWNGKQAAKASTPDKLPENALKIVEFYCKALKVPPGYASIGGKIDDVISWFK